MKAHYSLSVRRWFDKANGNSYHTIRIMGEGVDVTLPMDYGHGDLTYLSRASKALGVDIDLMTWEERREGFTIDETVVTRRKDLHLAGKTERERERERKASPVSAGGE